MLIGVLLYGGVKEQANAANLSPGNKWAVVIGIELYDHEQDLTYAVDDAEAMGARLEDLGFKVLSLTDGQATRKQILDLLEVDLRKLVQQKEDQVVIYFSGHGVTHPEEGVSRIGYIVPVEATRSRVYDEGIGMERLARYAKSLPAQQVLFLLDACYSGMAGTQEKSLPPLSEQRLKRLLREPGKYIMVAGSGNQKSLEGPEWKHGLFTHFLLNGLGPDKLADLNGDQLVTVGELFEYVKPRVEDEAEIQGKPQVPELWKLTGDQGQLAFVYEKVPGKIPVPIPGKLPQTITGEDGAAMVLIPEGTFWMGSTADEVEAVVKECMGYDYSEETCRGWFKPEMPRHKVSLKAFYMDTHEVTNRLFGQFVNDTGFQTTAEREGEAYSFVEGKGWELVKGAFWKKPEGKDAVFVSNRADHPVVSVSWDDAKAYCEKYGKRLPMEAEWEYAARAGIATRNWWGNDYPLSRRVANIADESAKVLFKNYLASYDDGFARTAPVGAMAANPWGLYDMIGNVWEWTADWYEEDYYEKSPEDKPKGPLTGTYRVLRGGSWVNVPFYARSAYRYRNVPALRIDGIGFRCVQDAP